MADLQDKKTTNTPLNFWFAEHVVGEEAIKDLPLAKTQEELVSKRMKYVGVAIPFVFCNGQAIDYRSFCPMDQEIAFPEGRARLLCADCLSVELAEKSTHTKEV